MNSQEELYKKAFNNGYLMAKHEPELLNNLVKEQNPQSDYVNALKLGRQEYQREKIKQALTSQQNSHDRTNEKER